MSTADKLLEKMRNNPLDDWRIEDLKAVARKYGFKFRQPGTSHITFSKEDYRLTVPAQIYITKFTDMIDKLLEKLLVE